MAPGVAAHIVQRGVNRQRCFQGDSDYLVYLSMLADAVERSGCAVHAYCLMSNHVHLLVTPPAESACSRLMYEVGQRYVPYFNRRHQRTGTLWEGRFRSCLVDSREYVLACYRYIELNPMRAAMVDSPSLYRWSSHRGNIGLRGDRLLTGHPEYLALADAAGSRHAIYRQFCADVESAQFLSAVRDATNTGIPLAGESLKLQLAKNGARIERGKPGPNAARSAQSELTSRKLDF